MKKKIQDRMAALKKHLREVEITMRSVSEMVEADKSGLRELEYALGVIEEGE